eukprot:5116354-Lingulodinium_polyedra.AAC.1
MRGMSLAWPSCPSALPATSLHLFGQHHRSSRLNTRPTPTLVQMCAWRARMLGAARAGHSLKYITTPWRVHARTQGLTHARIMTA